MSIKAIIIHTLLLLSCLSSKECDEYIKNLINNNFLTLKNYTILYSGLAFNNPGQMEECQLLDQFSYYLVYLESRPPELGKFTGLCIPSECTRDDVQEEASFYPGAETYGFDKNDLDVFGWIGLSIFFVYMAIVVAAMTVNSFRDEETVAKKQEPSDDKIQINMSINDRDLSSTEDLVNKPVRKYHKGVFLRIFDGYEHYTKIFHISPKRSILSGLRVMAVFMVIVATQFSFRQNIALNHDKSPKMLDNPIGYVISNVEFAYSVLLFAAGLSAAYALYKIDTFTGMFKGITAKFARTWPVLLIMIPVMYGLTQWFISDPLKKVWERKNTVDCPDVFWRKFLLINPLILDQKICLPWTWLVETELLLYLISPLFIVISKSIKWLGYVLLAIVVAISVIFSTFFLSYKKIAYYPNMIFNNEIEFVQEFQMNPLVRCGNFALGFMFSIFFINGLEKLESEGERPMEYRFAKFMKRRPAIQYVLQIIGFLLMTISFWLVVPVSKETDPSSNMVYFFLSATPSMFLLGLGLLITPSVLQGTSSLTNLINQILAGRFWVSLEKMSLMMYLLAPAIIGATTYSLQSSLYYSLESVFLLLLGDLLLIVLLSLVFTTCLEMPFIEAQKQLDYYIFGSSNVQSIVIIQD